MNIDRIEIAARAARREHGSDYIAGWYAVRDTVRPMLEEQGVARNDARHVATWYAHAVYEFPGWESTWREARSLLEASDPDAGWERASVIAESFGYRD